MQHLKPSRPARLLPLVCLLGLLPACTQSQPELPTAAAIAAEAAEAKRAGDWCAGHGVPESKCTRCNPELIPQFKAAGDWCAEHGLPESQCLKCNPELATAAAGHGNQGDAGSDDAQAGHDHGDEAHGAADWCKEHGLPESQCTKCNPSLVEKYIAAGDYCRDHGYPQSACPICEGTSPFPPEGMIVRLASAATADEAGIETTRAARRSFTRSLEVVGSLEFDPNRRADLAATVPGTIRKVHVDVGDAVAEGDPLVTLASAGVGASRADLQAARTAATTAQSRLERERRLFDKGLSPRSDLEEAERAAAAAAAALRTARSALSAAGASAASSGGTYVVRAPFAGSIVRRNATAGRSAAAGELLVSVADPRSIRARLEIPEAHAAAVRAGQPVELLLPGGASRNAELSAVAAAVDPLSRTIPARVDLANDDGSLKGGTFVRASIEIAAPQAAIVLPREAVQRVEGKSIVFVQQEPGTYRPVAVRLGASVGQEVAVAEGLQGGERVVTTGAFLLATETRKDSIGAGCCEVD